MNMAWRSKLFAVTPIESWPQLDVSVLSPSDATRHNMRKAALTLYAHGVSHKEIEERTGLPRQEVNRLLRRCTTISGDGQILGFRALTPHKHTVPYVRLAPVVCTKGSGGSGCAGALGQLFDRFPELQRFIEREYLRTNAGKKSHDVRVRIVDLHGMFINWLKAHGLTEDEWPLNTNNEGEETLRRYCHSLVDEGAESAIFARYGERAAKRSKLGTGVHRAFSMRRPFSAVQLDFHKVDAASVITIENPDGVEIEVPLARWHIGLLLEERFELILGVVVALEINPTSDSVLETIECALDPITVGANNCALVIGSGNRIFPNQLFEQLNGQCFSVLRMDNGWSNTAMDVINNVVDVVGCAVNFGPVRAWWGRDAIERVFGQMERASLQRSPSTYGSDVKDSRRKAPGATAERLHINLRDLIRSLEKVIVEHNSTRSESLTMGSPLAALEAAMHNPNSMFIPSPLPKVLRDIPLVMYKTLFVTVRGNRKTGERPYVKIGRWRFTNERIAYDFSLIGKELKAYCSIRDARVVFATLIETGEDLGRFVPPRRWSDTLISYRDRALFFSAGANERRSERRDRKASSWLPVESGHKRRARVEKSSEKPSAKEALVMARQEVQYGSPATPESDCPAPASSAVPSTQPATRFSLDRVVQIDHVFVQE